MRKLLFILLLLPLLGNAQVVIPSTLGFNLVSESPSIPPPPLDIYTGAAAAYSTRLLRTAYAGAAIRIRRSSDNAEQDIGFSASQLDIVSLLLFVGAANGLIVTWYDQSGNGNDLTQATTANQHTIVSSGVMETSNSKPATTFSGSQYLTLTSALSSVSDFSVFSVQDRAGTSDLLFSFANATNTVPFINYQNSDNLTYVADNAAYKGSTVTSGTGQKLFSGFGIGSNLYLYMNGVDVSGSGGSFSGASTFDVVGKSNTTNFALGKISELIFYQSDQTSNRAGIEANINAFYATY